MSVSNSTCWGCRTDQANQEGHMDLGGCLYSGPEKRNSTCWGCRENQPNQLAHMDTGGCMYEDFCAGCREDSDNELDHMERGGCIYKRARILENLSEKKEVDYHTISIQGILYVVTEKDNLLYNKDDLEKPICRYDPHTRMLSPLG